TITTTSEQFLSLVRRSGVADLKRLETVLDRARRNGTWSDDPKKLAATLMRDGVLTIFQSEQLLIGRHRGFFMGDYKLLEGLGAGGMGSVFLAVHKSTRERVALKILPKSVAEKPTILERFEREARAAVGLNHPNVVCALSFVKAGETRFMVMEYVPGQDLRSLVGRYGTLDPVRAAHYIRHAAEGLQHVHDAGLIHRDIKPANLMLDRAGTVKILDLGLARFVDDVEELTKQLGEGTVLGTADYLSPEQAVDSHQVDRPADIYSLGATLYFLLTSEPPV